MMVIQRWLAFSRSFFLVLASSCLPGGLPAQAQAATEARNHVVLITLDGLPARVLEDPRLPMPNLQRMMHEGARAKAMVPINPTVTWPNHTTLITGVGASVHHVMANGLITLPPGTDKVVVQPWVPKADLVHAPTLYDAGSAAGLTTGQVDWVAIYGARNIAWQFAEKPDPDGAIAKDLIAASTVTRDQLMHFTEGSSPAWRDQIWTDAAVDIITRHAPDLMLIHLLQTDSLQHAYGALTPAAYAAYANADACLGRIVQATRDAGILDRTTFFVVADHGFANYTHLIRPAAVFQQAADNGPTPQGSLRVLAEGGAAEIFATSSIRASSAFQRYTQLLGKTPGVQQVFVGKQLQGIGLPLPGSTDQAPDLYVTAQPGYSFADDPSQSVSETVTERGGHGYRNDDPDMQAAFVAWGAHIRPGILLPTFSNLRVAPTIALLLKLHLAQASAEPLHALLFELSLAKGSGTGLPRGKGLSS